MQRRIAIVVLNYLNYQDTTECIDSIFENEYKLCGIVIVDNGSNNESYSVLRDKYKNNKLVHVIRAKKNYGYAKGNNIGIRYSKTILQSDFVMIVNNDTVFIDKEYFNTLLSYYKPGVGVIGSKIQLKNGIEQLPCQADISINDLLCQLVNQYTWRKGSSFDFVSSNKETTSFLHGCALLFTPDFLSCYHGFYDRTFLYGEEIILYFMCRYKGLNQVYVDETSIYHKEDQSSIASFNNDQEKINEYSFQSKRYAVFWSLKCCLKEFVTSWRIK